MIMQQINDNYRKVSSPCRLMEDWFSASVEMVFRCHFAVLFPAVAKKMYNSEM